MTSSYENAIRLEDAYELIVGNVYQVRCVLWKKIWMPVIAGWHCESELGDDHRHIHFDIRFLDTKRLKRLNIYGEGQLKYNSHTLGILSDSPYLKSEHIEYMPLKCRRIDTYSELRPHPEIERLVADKILSNCKRCPHRGTDLRHIRPNEKGVIVCPAHGVRWDASTGKQVKWALETITE